MYEDWDNGMQNSPEYVWAYLSVIQLPIKRFAITTGKVLSPDGNLYFLDAIDDLMSHCHLTFTGTMTMT